MGIIVRRTGSYTTGLVLAGAFAQAVSPTPSPTPAPEGVIPSIAHVFSWAATWLSSQAMQYGGSPFCPSVSAILLIVLIVSVVFWLRRPKRPLETRAPM